MTFSKKKLFAFFAAVTVAGILFGSFATRPEPVYAKSYDDITSDSIEAKKDEVADAKKEQENIKNTISNMQKIVDDLKSKRNDVDKYIETIDGTMADIQARIQVNEDAIARKEEEITVKEEELSAAEQQVALQYEAMSQRIQYIYEFGDNGYFEALLRADSFSDMLNRAEYVEEMAAYDDQMLESFILNTEYIALCKESLEVDKDTLEQSKQALYKEQQNLETVRSQKAADLAAFDTDINLTLASIKEQEEDLKFQTDLISSLEKEITDEQREILKEQGITLGYDGSGFACPAPSYVRISSEFGWRKDPINGLQAYHNGIDMAAAEGTPIVAAFDGIVGEASYNSSMGNYIYLEHGDGLRTIYLHASELYVKKNDVVLKGETIGAVGTTGRSTGPHLHFSVRLNGEYVSPWNYLSR